MYDWKDILIVGDSFCADRLEADSWPQVLTCKLTNSTFKENRLPRGRGYPGASWWAPRKKLLEELNVKVPKVLLICHTEPFRIPHDKNLGLNTKSVFSDALYVPQDEEHPGDEFLDAAKKYFMYIFSSDFHQWTYSQWLEEVDDIIAKYKIEKSLHFYCFEGPYNSKIFKSGLTINYPLANYQNYPVWQTRHKLLNHFTVNDNLKFADSVYNLIVNYPGRGSVIGKKLIGN